MFEYIKAYPFFRDYVPDVKSHKHKIRGKNGRNNPTQFTAEENKLIAAGLKKMASNMLKCL